MDFGIAPFLAIWETTRACGLACRHCRAEAAQARNPDELSTQDGKRLLDEIAAMGTSIVILSGGDPLERPDLEELIRHAKMGGLRVGTIPAATGKLSRSRIGSLRDAGLDQLAVSLDGPTAAAHDDFRKTPGSFDRTLQGAAFAHEAGLPLQVNTCFGGWNFEQFEEMAGLVQRLDAVFWEVFFLVPMGRGRELKGLAPAQYEFLFARLHLLARERRFIVKVTEAQHYRRFVIQKESAHGEPEKAKERVREILARPRGAGNSLGMSPEAVNSGKGFVFIDHVGEVYPSGFLPIRAGNVKTDSLAQAYRESPLFKELRAPDRLKGRCGACEFRSVCGGSRARAYAATGDYLEDDPCCGYLPEGYGGHLQGSGSK